MADDTADSDDLDELKAADANDVHRAVGEEGEEEIHRAGAPFEQGARRTSLGSL